MVMIVPFRALRPKKEYAPLVASLPYDVVDTGEAREIIRKNPLSFLRVEKSEADFPRDFLPQGKKIYERARQNLEELMRKGILLQDAQPHFYIYAQGKDGCRQYGIVGCVSVEDYEEERIKKHELTRNDKEKDRILHVDNVNAHTGPVFITYRAKGEIDHLVDSVTTAPPLYDFTTDDGITHTVWQIIDSKKEETLKVHFAAIDRLYIADGHHRAAAAAAVAKMRRRGNPSRKDRESEFMLAVLFPHHQMRILPYHRLVRDLAGLKEEEFLLACTEKFDLSPAGEKKLPTKEHELGMFLQGKWYRLKAKESLLDKVDCVQRLDVSLLQEHLLGPILKITDPRTDSRIAFVGGSHGIEELERKVQGGDFAVAFSLYPVTVEQLMEIADAGKIMPPKSTWFEPKLRSGLFVHLLE